MGLIIHDLVFGIEDLVHRLVDTLAQSGAVKLQHLQRLVPPLGEAGDQEFHVLVEVDGLFQRVAMIEFRGRAVEDFVDVLVAAVDLTLQLCDAGDVGGGLGQSLREFFP